MKLNYHQDTDTLYLELQDTSVSETKELDENTILDLGEDGNVLAITFEHASERLNLAELVATNLPAKKLQFRNYDEKSPKQFEKWMCSIRRRQLKESTAKAYTDAIENYLSSFARKLGIIRDSIFYVTCPHEFKKVKSKIESEPEFVRINEKRHSLLSSALNCYAEFLIYETGGSSH